MVLGRDLLHLDPGLLVLVLIDGFDLLSFVFFLFFPPRCSIILVGMDEYVPSWLK